MNSFSEFGLKDPILQALEDINFVEPTPIQAETLGLLINSDQDLIGLAQTGTGKTAAFSLPIIHNIDLGSKQVQAIILCPTRELCMQIGKDIQAYSKYLPKLRTQCVYGGSPIHQQVKALERGCQLVVGTPGRTLDLIRRRKLKLQEVRWVVLDEADEMLNMGFQEDLNSILAETPDSKQTLLFSATMPNEIARMTKKYMDDPIEISAGTKNSGAKNVSHEYYLSAPRDRYSTLKAIIDSERDMYAIVFCRTRRETKDVAEKLRNQGYAADALHGELSQGQRDKVMGKFRNRQLQLMVATDVAARGLDVDNLTHVINFNLPDELGSYIHRSGRTGRAGQKGISIAIIHSREKKKLYILEKKLGAKFVAGVLPTAQERARKQLFAFVDELEKVEVNAPSIEEFLPEVLKKLSWLTKEDLVARLLSREFARLGLNAKPDYGSMRRSENRSDRSRPDRGRPDRERADRGRPDRTDRTRSDRDRNDRNHFDKTLEKRDRRDKPRREKKERINHYHNDLDSNFSRFYINLGKKKVDPKGLIGLVNELMHGDSFEIGKIEIFGSFSFFEIESTYEENVLKAFRKADYKGDRLKVELAVPKRR